jgi:hypothetical protein
MGTGDAALPLASATDTLTCLVHAAPRPPPTPPVLPCPVVVVRPQPASEPAASSLAGSPSRSRRRRRCPSPLQSRFHHHPSPARPLPRPLRCTANLSCAASLYDCRLQPSAQPAPDRAAHPWSHLAQRAFLIRLPPTDPSQPSPSRPSPSSSFQASCACVPPKSRLPACIAPQVLSPAAS